MANLAPQATRLRNHSWTVSLDQCPIGNETITHPNTHKLLRTTVDHELHDEVSHEAFGRAGGGNPGPGCIYWEVGDPKSGGRACRKSAPKSALWPQIRRMFDAMGGKQSEYTGAALASN